MSFYRNIQVSCLGLCLAPLSVIGAKSPIGFSEPKVLKLDWSTRALQVIDIDADGLTDMAVINNDTAQIELMYQLSGDEKRSGEKRSLNRDRWEPILEDADFNVEKLTIGFPMFDLGVGDLNGDGLPDLAYSARDTPLTIRYQGESGQWLETQEFDGFDALGWNSTLQVADVDGDGREEIILLAADAVRVFSADSSGRLGEAEVYYLTGENPFNLEVVDITGDGLSEICYITTEGKQSLVMREQLTAGSFGAERRFVFERPVRMYSPLILEKPGSVSLVSVDSRSGSLEFFDIKPAKKAAGEHPLDGVQPQIYPVFKKTNDAANFAHGDLNGDGEPDLQVSNPSGSELIVYIKENGRFSAPKRFPSFSGISSLSAGRFFKTDEEAVVVLSRDESMLGLSEYNRSGRVSFPRQIQVGEGEPLVCEAIDLDEDGFDELALVNDLGGTMQLLIAKPKERARSNSDWEVVYQMDLEGVRRKPTSIRALDVFGKLGAGLMIFVPREAPVLLAPKQANQSYALEVVGDGSSIRESLLKEVKPSQISEIDVDGDGYKELVAARTGFARAIRIRDGNLEMVDQFNARRSKDVVAAVIPSPKAEGLALYVPKEGELQFLSRDEDGVLRYRHSEKLGSMELTGWAQLEGRGKAEDTFLLLGEDRFWYFAAHADSWAREVGENYETELERVHFGHVNVGDFDGDGLSDLIAVDGNEHVVEILTNESGDIHSQMFWGIFDQNMHYQGRNGGKVEPRQTRTGDLNGDGRLDFAFLIHDRIIFYFQE